MYSNTSILHFTEQMYNDNCIDFPLQEIAKYVKDMRRSRSNSGSDMSSVPQIVTQNSVPPVCNGFKVK